MTQDPVRRQLRLQHRVGFAEMRNPNGRIRAASYFHLTDEGAMRILGEVHSAVSRWRQVARGAVVGMSAAESEAFEPAFDHEETRSAKRRLA
jgi:hypothetical protein